MRLTKSSVDNLQSPVPIPPAKHAQAFYRDDQLIGFAVRITETGACAFIVETKVNGKTRRKTLGRYPNLTVEQARKLAQKRLGMIAAGRDPEAEKKESQAVSVTLAQAFADYLIARKNLTPATLRGYRDAMRLGFGDWQGRALKDLSKDMVEKRHRLLAETRGEASANLFMRVLRAVFNFAANTYEDARGRTLFPENPVRRLSATRAWYRIERRQSVIKTHQLRAWYAGVMSLKSETVRDFLCLMLFTGLRKHEAAKLTWEHVDLADRTLLVIDPKNHHDHLLPLPSALHARLTQRQGEAGLSPYVFPGDGKTGYLIEPRKQIAHVIANSGVDFTPHDLRRTFITVAESLDIPAYALKRLLNHRMGSDVTAGYIIADVERLRRPMQQIEDFILKSAGVQETAEVIELTLRPPESSLA